MVKTTQVRPLAVDEPLVGSQSHELITRRHQSPPGPCSEDEWRASWLPYDATDDQSASMDMIVCEYAAKLRNRASPALRRSPIRVRGTFRHDAHLENGGI
jgi:hypothetical protein